MQSLRLAVLPIFVATVASCPAWAQAAPAAVSAKSYPGYLCQTFISTQPFSKTAIGAIVNPSVDDVAQGYACIAVHERIRFKTTSQARGSVVVVDNHPDSGVYHQVTCYLRSFQADGTEFASPIQATTPAGGSPIPVTMSFGDQSIAVPLNGSIRIDCNVPPDASALGGGKSGIVSYTVEEF